MARMSQKELLDEGIASLLKKTAQAAGGTIGAVGGALKAVSDAGINATWADAAKGGAAGAKKGWKGVKKVLTSREEELREYITDLGYMIKPGTVMRQAKGNSKMKVVDIVDLDYNDKGEPISGEGYPRPKIFSYEDGRWQEKIRRGSRRLQQRDPKNKEKADQLDQEEAGTPPETPQPEAPAAPAPADVGTAGEFGVTPTFKPGDTVSFTNKKGEVKGVKVIKDLGTGKSEVKFSNGSVGAVDNKQLQATAEKEVSKESFSQKNLLRGLHMLHG